MLYKVEYSYDCNVLRAIPKSRNQSIKFVPFTLGGRNLTKTELMLVARKEWGADNIVGFHCLQEGQG